MVLCSILLISFNHAAWLVAINHLLRGLGAGFASFEFYLYGVAATLAFYSASFFAYALAYVSATSAAAATSLASASALACSSAASAATLAASWSTSSYSSLA